MKEGSALRWLSRLSWFAGRREEADRYAVEAVATLESLPPSPELAMAYSNRAQLDMEAHEIDSAIDWAQRTITLAEPWENHEILSDALNTLGTVRLIAGDTSGWADLDRSLQLALAGGFQDAIARAYTNLCAMAVSRRQYEPASRYLRQGLEYCERHDLDSWWLYLLAYSARMKFEQGDWNGASDDAEAVLRHSRTTPVTRIPTLRVLGHLRIRRGDPDASAPLEEARALAGTIPELQRIGTLAAASAEAAWLAGDRAGVLREVQPAYEMVRHRRDPRMKGELAAWLWRVDALEQLPTDIPEPYALEISRDWRGAARAWKELGCPYERALVLGWYGTEPEQREALAILDQLGAAPAAQASAPADARARRPRSSARLTDIDSTQSTRSDAARSGDSCTVVRGLAQRGHSQAPVRFDEDRRPPRLGDPGETRRAITRRGGRDGTQAVGQTEFRNAMRSPPNREDSPPFPRSKSPHNPLIRTLPTQSDRLVVARNLRVPVGIASLRVVFPCPDMHLIERRQTVAIWGSNVIQQIPVQRRHAAAWMGYFPKHSPAR